MISLRPYQETIVRSTVDGFGQFRKQLIVVPTGGGKTIIFSALAQHYQPERTLILAHREELIDQAIEKLYRATGILAQKEKAEFEASLLAPAVVASVQTMSRRLHKWPSNHFGLVVADEAHHAISQSWQTVLTHFDAKVLGVTATPDRGDKRNLGSFFENIPAEISLFDLIPAFLSRIAVKSIPIQIDLANVKQTAGDFNETDLGNALEPYMNGIAKTIKEQAANRRTLVFLPLRATSMEFVRRCREQGLSAEHIDGESPDRKQILARFAAGEFRVLCNAMLLTEGFDDPGIDCVVVLRPTRSRSLYSQMVGRGTRVAPGKENLLLLDFLWLHETHNLIRPAHLIAESEEVAAQITEMAQKAAAAGMEQEELDLQILDNEVRKQREEKLKEALRAKAKRQAKTIDAMDFCLSLHATSVAEYEPTMEWENAPVSDRQRQLLERYGFDISSITSAGHASKMIDLLVTRSRLKLATPKQVRLLRQFKHPRPFTATCEEASRYLDRIFNRGKRESELAI